MSDSLSDTKGNGQFDAWLEMERALSLVHVTGLELVAEVKTAGERSESAAREKFEDALTGFHEALALLGILPAALLDSPPGN
jgi:hypothetical protein